MSSDSSAASPIGPRARSHPTGWWISVSRGRKRSKLGRMEHRVLLWGLGVCLALLAIELSLMAVTRNWLALTLTLAAVAAVAAATYLKVRQMDHSRRLRL